ncbi:hypothetical protein D364_23885 [Klebsiella pneumoniae CG43]|nr:hypothetical protein D364_23885 [Klebsiella pneumoniae CG43]ARN28382.1 hypothetical protein A4U70_23125 [Klebsiella pneumoniae]
MYSIILSPYRLNSRIHNCIQFILTISYNICKYCRVEIIINSGVIIRKYFCNKTIYQKNTSSLLFSKWLQCFLDKSKIFTIPFMRPNNITDKTAVQFQPRL